MRFRGQVMVAGEWCQLKAGGCVKRPTSPSRVPPNVQKEAVSPHRVAAGPCPSPPCSCPHHSRHRSAPDPDHRSCHLPSLGVLSPFGLTRACADAAGDGLALDRLGLASDLLDSTAGSPLGAGTGWTPPLHVSQQALNVRLRTLPSALLQEVVRQVLPDLAARSRARHRPRPPVIERALQQVSGVWAVDATTLEALFKKVELLDGIPGTVLAGNSRAGPSGCGMPSWWTCPMPWPRSSISRWTGSVSRWSFAACTSWSERSAGEKPRTRWPTSPTQTNVISAW